MLLKKKMSIAEFMFSTILNSCQKIFLICAFHGFHLNSRYVLTSYKGYQDVVEVGKV